MQFNTSYLYRPTLLQITFFGGRAPCRPICTIYSGLTQQTVISLMDIKLTLCISYNGSLYGVAMAAGIV